MDWDDMNTQEQNAALAEMMGLSDRWYIHHYYVSDYTACFEGPVAWAKEQGWAVIIHAEKDDPYVNCRVPHGEWAGEQDYMDFRVLGDSHDAICQAIWEAAMEMRKEQE